MTNLNSLFKSRDITFPTKVCLVKAMVFPVVMYGCESWTVKKAEGRRIDAFELWCWRTLLRVPWTARRSSQSILKEISPEYSLEVTAQVELDLWWETEGAWASKDAPVRPQLAWLGRVWAAQKERGTQCSYVPVSALG